MNASLDPSPVTRVLTILFTDVVGSTAIKQRLGDRDGARAMVEHHAILREVLGQFSEGTEIETAGDSFLLTFETPSAAVRFALLARARLHAWNAGRDMPVVDRYALHMGEVVVDKGSLYSIAVDTCARVLGLAEGERILLTRSVFDSARQHLKRASVEGLGEITWVSHGPYLLKGVDDPVEVCEVGEIADGAPPPPPDSDKATRQDPAGSRLVTGWRPAAGEAIPGTTFRLIERVGEGAVGEAWVAASKTLAQKRVFKFCFQPERVRSLRREVALFRVMRERLGEHPGIVGVVDVHLDDAPYFLVFEWSEGGDLQSWWLTRPDPPTLQTRLDIVAQIAEALQAAHEAGVVHRDVKPANVLVEESVDGSRMRLTDFGIGQVTSIDVLAGLTSEALGVTIVAGSSTSSPSGTQIYLAPELLQGLPASPRSDIYALGVLLWQILVGDLRRPLPQDWQLAVADPILREDLDLALAGDPDRRLSSALELARRLRAFPERRAAAEAEARARAEMQRRAYRKGVRRTAAVAAAIVVLVVGLAGLAIRAAQEADALAEANRQALYQGLVDGGRSRLEQGDRMGALPYFAEALAIATGPSVELARMRLAEATAQGPRLALVVKLGDSGADVALSPSGDRLVTVERTGMPAFGPRRTEDVDRGAVRLWDVASATLLGSPFDLGARGWSAEFSADGTAIAVVSESKRLDGKFAARSSVVRVFDASTLTLIGGPWSDETPSLCGLRMGGFTDDGRSVWTACGGGLAMWERSTGTRLRTPRVPQGSPCAISEDGRIVLACLKTKTGEPDALLAVDRASGKVVGRPRMPTTFEVPMSLDRTGSRETHAFGDHGALVSDLTAQAPFRTTRSCARG